MAVNRSVKDVCAALCGEDFAIKNRENCLTCWHRLDPKSQEFIQSEVAKAKEKTDNVFLRFDEGVITFDECLLNVADGAYQAKQIILGYIQENDPVKAVAITIASVDFVPKAWDRTQVVATFTDGEVSNVFGYFPDELSFSSTEFIGLTRQGALDLFAKKDTAYLRS